MSALQREALLANPLLDFNKLLVLKRQFPRSRLMKGRTLGTSIHVTCRTGGIL